MPNPRIVQKGLYRSFTRAEMDIEDARYKAEVKLSHSRLVSASISGQSYQFAETRSRLHEWNLEIQFAYRQIAPGYFEDPPGNAGALRIA